MTLKQNGSNAAKLKIDEFELMVCIFHNFLEPIRVAAVDVCNQSYIHHCKKHLFEQMLVASIENCLNFNFFELLLF